MIRALDGLRREVASALADDCGGRLRGLPLYFSPACGDHDGESDVDLLVLLDQVDEHGNGIDGSSETVATLSGKCAIDFSAAFVCERDGLSGDSAFLREVREEAVAA